MSVSHHSLVSPKLNCSLTADLSLHLYWKEFMTPEPGQPIEKQTLASLTRVRDGKTRLSIRLRVRHVSLRVLVIRDWKSFPLMDRVRRRIQGENNHG